jgi:hypothetical protein
MRSIVVIFAMLATAGCGCGPDTETGCGVAGASFDAKRVREEVENYQYAYLDQVQIRTSANNCLGWKQGTSAEGLMRLDDPLHRFPVNVALESNSAPLPLGQTGLRAALVYARDASGGFHTIRIWNNAGVVVEERLPQAFLYPVLMGITSIGGREVLVATTRSRSTTGRRFLAMYSPAGALLYRNVHLSGAVWDVALEDDAVVLLGCGQSTHIALRDGA